MTKCKHCGRVIWPWQERSAALDAHQGCERISIIFDKTLENMRHAGDKSLQLRFRQLKKLQRGR